MESSGADSVSGAKVPSLTRREIFYLRRGNLNECVTVLYNEIEAVMIARLGSTFELSETCKQSLRLLMKKMQNKWQQCRRVERDFLKKNDDWLNAVLYFQENNKFSSSGPGRPPLDFNKLTERTKRQRTNNIRSESSTAELSYAIQMSLRASGQLNAAKVVKDVTFGGPSKASKYRRSIELAREKPLTPDEAVLLLVEAKWSKNTYQLVRNVAVQHNSTLYPTYKTVEKAKNACYPPQENLTVSEDKAEVDLQALLDHTVVRILLAQKEVIKSMSPERVRNLTLICKWGSDGSSGQSQYKQKFANDDGYKSDANMFLTSIVPLRLVSTDPITKIQTIVWRNPRASSPYYCRRIRMQYLQETVATTKEEIAYIREQETNPTAFETVIAEKNISVSYNLALTIALASSAQRCHLCKKTISNFNKIDEILKANVIEDNLEYGISSLHACIRCLECLLHISYKLDVKKQGRLQVDEKEKENARKQKIQEDFCLRLGLIVDKPKQGSGNSNDGNTARSFFQNKEVSADITGIDVRLIHRFHVILQTISSGYEIQPEFKIYALDTARLYVELYGWYNMPTAVHKIFMHGAEIIASSPDNNRATHA